MELKLEVWDSPNSAGIVIDAVRMCKLALNKGVGGALKGPSSYLMKSPPEQVPDPIAHDDTEEFIRKHALKPVAETKKAKGSAKGSKAAAK
jgi:myo-inositol-1-phosphate synthase